MRILVVVHTFPPQSTGGAETYAAAHALALAAGGHQVTVLTRESDPSKAEYSTRSETRDGLQIVWINNTFRQVASFAETYANPAIDALAARLIETVRPDVAHVHHLTCLSTGIVGLLNARRVPVVCTLHDYWFLCHRGQLFDTNHRVCAGPDPDRCRACLGPAATMDRSAYAAARVVRRLEQTLPRRLAAWFRRTAERTATRAARGGGAGALDAARRRLEHMRAVMDQVTAFVAPSEALKQRFVAAGVTDDRIQFWPYGHDHSLFPQAVRGTRASPTSGPHLRLGFLGSVMISKAPHVFLEAFAGLPAGVASAEVFGAYTPYHGDDSYRGIMDPLLSLPGVKRRGPIPHEAVPAALASIDVLVVPSIWAENSPLVIREAFLAGVPVVASRVGGIPEAVVDGVNGLLVNPGDVAAMRRTLGRLLDDHALLTRLQAGAVASPVRTLTDDVESTERLYASVLTTVSPRRERLAAVVLHFGDPNETRLTVLSLLASRRPVDDLIVVDNDPGRRADTTLRDLRDRIDYVESSHNCGFSAGMNLGIRVALGRGASEVFLVNNDVIVPPETTGRLEHSLQSDPRLGAVGPVVLSRRDPGRVGTDGMSYRSGTGRMRHPGFGAKVGRCRAGAATRVADGISGCAMLLRHAALEAAGLFDEAYFFGFEDLDWCLRARRAGFLSAVAQDASVYHEGGRAIGSESPRGLYFAARNHLKLARSEPVGGGVGRVLRSAVVIGLNLAHAARSGGSSLPARLRAVARGVRDDFSGTYGPGR
jgi:GT2 family glycosyltransferase/glycosyltransferase involved in cell wall biosynthesis